MNQELSIAFIGGGNMASALASGLIGKRCAARDILVVDPSEQARAQWETQGVLTAAAPDDRLAGRRVWILAVKPQYLKEAVQGCRPYLRETTLVVSVAAGIGSSTLSRWLGGSGTPFSRLVRCMPNTPALIGAGASGLMALDGVTDEDRQLAQQMLAAVSEVVWVPDDAGIDAVTALSGSGPAYVFLFLEALIEGGIAQGLSPEQARKLAIATVNGATQLAALSHESLPTLRERVTSRGGTTAAALNVFTQQDFRGIVQQAMQAARDRAQSLCAEFS